MTLVIRPWIYEEIQTTAQKYMRTICWDKFENYEFVDLTNDEYLYSISVNGIVKETEKAVCFDCNYWSTRGYRANFTVYSGHKVWIPKSAILKMPKVA